MRGFKAGLAAALSVLYTEERLPQVFQLIKDPSHGDSRSLLIAGLRKLRKNEKVKEFLLTLYEDPYWGRLARETLEGKRRR
jgi:hypothetical protein